MSKLIVIGFSGKQRAGKSTAASAVLARFGGVRVSFADELKAEIKDLLGIEKGHPLFSEHTYAHMNREIDALDDQREGKAMDTDKTAAHQLVLLVGELVKYGFISQDSGTRILDLACAHACEAGLQGVRIGENRAIRLGEGAIATERELQELVAWFDHDEVPA